MHRFVVHGHFYQPPREEPWLDLVPREPTAAPDHDWNVRITRECYAPLAQAPVLDRHDRVRRVINAYAWCSFDVGPTLLKWFDSYAPGVRDAMVAGDHESRARTGFGNALAMPYHHLILPLATRRDKVTEVRWGIRDFRTRFGRVPEGMWLPETAVDSETLSVLAAEGIRFTVLAPHQMTGMPRFGRPGRWTGPDGESLAIFTYDGELAHGVAFGDLLKRADQWRESMLAHPEAMDGEPSVVAVATDGETFGHHHRFGDLGLAHLIDASEAELTNFAALLAAHPPEVEVTLVERTSWSCPHGVERWRSNCGCRMDPHTSQEWRVPLRTGLDALARGVHDAVEAAWPAGVGDVDAARDAAGGDLGGAREFPADARRLLEAEFHALAMFSSCAWFFDDLARLEPLIVLRHAARALEFLPAGAAAPLDAALLATLAQAHSNDPADGDGLTIWRRDVLTEAHGTARLAAGLAALRDIAPDMLDELVLPTHTWRLDGDDIVTRHRRTDVEHHWHTETVTFGVIAERVRVRPPGVAEELTVPISGYPEPIKAILREIARPMALDAALGAADRDAVRAGLLDATEARDRALAGAWALVARDGVEAADIVVHGVLDLFDLDAAAIPDIARTTAFLQLSVLLPSRARDVLADRLTLIMPEPTVS